VRGSSFSFSKLAVLGLLLSGLAVPESASGERAVKPRPVAVARMFVAAANRGDYATVCRLYSRRHHVSQRACRSLYRWGASFYGRFDYRIVRSRQLRTGHWRYDLIRWQHPSFIELALEDADWRIVAGGL
jgi:hypothetical protein